MAKSGISATSAKLFKGFTLNAALCLSVASAVPVHAANIGGLFNSLLGQTGSEKVNLDETLVRMSQKMNRQLPQTVDTSTRLEKVSAEPGQQFAYYYTLVNSRSNEIETASFYQTLRPVLQKRVCAAEDLKIFFRNRITLAYAYRGNDGEDIGKLAFSPRDCGYPG
ncbi:MAG: hypothetical protein V4695_12130 [Pseudomonadota bacterium]